MKNMLYCCFSLLVLASCNVFRPSANAILVNSEKKLDALERLRYKAELLKTWQGEDTTALQAHVILEKGSTMKTLGFKVKLEYPSKGEIRFNGDTIYALDAPNKKLWITDVATMGTGPITGNLNGEVIGEVFTQKDPFGLNTEGKKITWKLNGTVSVNNQKCWVIEGLEQTAEQELAVKYFISRKSYLPLKTQTHLRYQDQASFTEWKISEINTWPMLSASLFSKPVVPADYAIETVETPREETPALLPNQVSAPPFKLPDLSRDTIELSKLKGKVIVLDFWYMSCPPCIKALPHLQQLYEKYQAQGLMVLGINSKDNNEKDLKRLPGFLENRKLTYPVLLSSEETDKAYAVTAYPSLYLIDSSGKIAYSQIGFGEEAITALTKEIEKLLKEKE